MSNKQHYKFACVYTDGGMRTLNDIPGAGAGVHGYFFDELESMRYAGVKQLVTINGYKAKPTGDELKNKKYNPTFNTWGLEQSFRDAEGTPCKVLKSADITIVDGWHGISNQPTNNRGEMQAFIDLFRSCPVTADNYMILADSMLLIRGYNKDMEVWKSKGWAKSDGQEPKNLDLWLEIDKIKTEFGDKITIDYIQAHAGHFGNECADRNATFGLCGAVNGDTQEHWITTQLSDPQYWEPSKPVPPILRVKWCYGMTGKHRRYLEVDGVKYHHYFGGDHSKNADDAELLGKEISDAGFVLVYNKQQVPIIDKVIEYHTDNMWEHNCEMYRSNVINMVRIANVNTPNALWCLNRVNYESLMFKSHRNDLVIYDEKLISQMIRPPKLSYRSMDIESELMTVLYSSLLKLGKQVVAPTSIPVFNNLVLNDVTELFYKPSKKGAIEFTDFYDQIAKSLLFNVKHPCSDSEVDLIMTAGIDMPMRNNMKALCAEHPKVYIVTWKFSNKSFKYGMLIETDESISFWEGYYSSRRDLDE